MQSPNVLRDKDIPRLEAVQSSLCSKTGANPPLFVLIWVQDPYQMQSIRSDHVYKWSPSILNDGTFCQTMCFNGRNICVLIWVQGPSECLAFSQNMCVNGHWPFPSVYLIWDLYYNNQHCKAYPLTAPSLIHQ